MHYILFIILHNYTEPSITTAEFNSQGACITALTEINMKLQDYKKTLFCVEKGK